MTNCVWCNTPLEEPGICDQCFSAWPKCAVPACTNKSCLRLSSKYCWPHTPGELTPKDVEEETEEDLTL